MDVICFSWQSCKVGKFYSSFPSSGKFLQISFTYFVPNTDNNTIYSFSLGKKKHLPGVKTLQLQVYVFLKGSFFNRLYYYMRNFCNLIGLEQWYSRLPITRTFRGNRKKFELPGVQVIGSSKKIAESKVKNSFYCTVNILITFNCRNVKWKLKDTSRL